MAPINALGTRIADEVGMQVPAADPDYGGVRARMMMLLRDPGTATDRAGGSGFVSPDNNDPTAERVHGLLQTHGIAPQDVLAWNVVPWLRPGNAGQSLRVGDYDRGMRWLAELLGMLQRLRVVLVLGRDAQQALRRSSAPPPEDVIRIDAPHPGRRAQNQPALRAALDEAFSVAAHAVADNADRKSVIDLWPHGSQAP